MVRVTDPALRRRPTRPPDAPRLDPAQARVVHAEGGPLLVLAGPGTGKTTTLVEAVVDRVERRGLAPEQVLVLTFSRKAAQELRERVTARLTWGRVLLGGLLSGVWLGVFVGLIISLFGRPSSTFGLLLFAALWGGLFGVVWAAAGYAFTRGQRDFSSVTQVVATRYEVFCEHKFAQQGRQILAEAGLTSTAAPAASATPPGPPDPFRPPSL